MLVHRSIEFLEVCVFGLQADIQCSSLGRGSFFVLEGGSYNFNREPAMPLGVWSKKSLCVTKCLFPLDLPRGKYLTQADFCSVPSVISSVQQRLCKCQITEQCFLCVQV